MGWLKEFGEVDLGAIERPNVAPDWTHSKSGHSRAEIDGWVKQLQTVQNLSQTQRMHYEDFQRMRESTNPEERALGQTHHRFYDHDREGPQTNGTHIKLTWNNGRFQVENGHHRIDRGHALGLRLMPAAYSVLEEERAAASTHVHRNGPLSPSDRDEPARQQDRGHQAVPQPSRGERSATPAWERSSKPTPVRGERTRS